MRVVIFWTMCHHSLGHEKKALLISNSVRVLGLTMDNCRGHNLLMVTGKMEKWLTLGNWSHLEKWVTLGEMDHIWKNGSHLEKWVILGKIGDIFKKMGHTWKNGSCALGKMGPLDQMGHTWKNRSQK